MDGTSCKLTSWLNAAAAGDVIYLSKNLTALKRSQGEDGRTALMYAVRGMDGEKCAYHKSYGSNIIKERAKEGSAADDVSSSSSFSISAVTLLARHEAGMVDNEGTTALCYAAEVDNEPACITLYPVEGSIVPKNGVSALMRAARNRSMQVVPLLIKTHGPNYRDQQGHSALDHACLGGSLEAVEYLLNNGYGTTLIDINRAISAASSVRSSAVVDLLAYVRLARINNTVPCTKCWHNEAERRAADAQMHELKTKYEALLMETSGGAHSTDSKTVLASNQMETTMLQYRINYFQRLLSRFINESVASGICNLALSPKLEVYSYADVGKYSKSIFQAFKQHAQAVKREEAKVSELQRQLAAAKEEIAMHKDQIANLTQIIAASKQKPEIHEAIMQTALPTEQNSEAQATMGLRSSSLIVDSSEHSHTKCTHAPDAGAHHAVSPPRSSTAIQRTPSPAATGASSRPIASPFSNHNIEEELSDITVEQPPLAELRSSAVLFDSGANTLLMQAALLDDSSAVRKFLDQAGMINRNGRTALMMAANIGNSEIVGLLVETGKETRKQDHEGRTALYFAVKGLHYSSIRHLAPHEAGLQKNDGQTSLMIGAKRGGTSLLTLLDVEVGMQSTDGWTALMAAADSGNIEACTYLIPREAGLSMKSGWTALMSAAWNGHLDIVNLLLEKEAGRQKTNGFTALMAAARNGNLDCLKILIPHELELKQTSGKTALDWCNEYEQQICAEFITNYSKLQAQLSRSTHCCLEYV